MSYIKVLGRNAIKLTGSYGCKASAVAGPTANAAIDATGASWIVANNANLNPDAGTTSLEQD